MNQLRTTLHTVEGRLTTCFLLLHLLIAVSLVFQLSLQPAELVSLEISSGDLGTSLRKAVSSGEAPFYFAVLQIWRTVCGESVSAARLFSVLCSAGAVLSMVAVSRRYLPRIHSPRLVGVVALHPFILWCAVEASCHAMIILLTALQLVAFFDGFVAGTDRTHREEELRRCRSRVWYITLAVCGIYTHYWLGLLLLSGAATILVLRRIHSLKVYLASMGVTCVCLLPLAGIAAGLMLQNHNGQTEEPAAFDTVLQVGRDGLHVLLPLVDETTSFSLTVTAWKSLPVLILALLLWRYRRFFTWKRNDFLFWQDNVIALSMTTLMLVSTAGAVVLTDACWSDRSHGTVLFLPMLLLSFAIAGGIAGNRAVGWWSCLILCFGLAAMLSETRCIAVPTEQSSWVANADGTNTTALSSWIRRNSAVRVRRNSYESSYGKPT